MSIQVLPGDSDPPSVSRNPEGSSFAFSSTDRADRISSAATLLVFAAFLRTFTLSSTSFTPNNNKTQSKKMIFLGNYATERKNNKDPVEKKHTLLNCGS